MSIQALLIRFFLIYLCMLVIAGIVVSLFDAKAGSAINSAVLLSSVMGVCWWFAYKNKRYFTPSEKRNVVLGMLAIDIAIQTVVAVGMLASQPTGWIFPLLFGVLFVGALHAALIWVFVGLAGKQFAKDVAKRG